MVCSHRHCRHGCGHVLELITVWHHAPFCLAKGGAGDWSRKRCRRAEHRGISNILWKNTWKADDNIVSLTFFIVGYTLLGTTQDPKSMCSQTQCCCLFCFPVVLFQRGWDLKATYYAKCTFSWLFNMNMCPQYAQQPSKYEKRPSSLFFSSYNDQKTCVKTSGSDLLYVMMSYGT